MSTTPSPSPMRPRTRPGTRFSEVLDVHLTAQCLTVSADTVYDLFQHDALPGWKVGRTGLITTAAVLWWLEASTTQRTTAAQDGGVPPACGWSVSFVGAGPSSWWPCSSRRRCPWNALSQSPGRLHGEEETHSAPARPGGASGCLRPHAAGVIGMGVRVKTCVS